MWTNDHVDIFKPDHDEPILSGQIVKQAGVVDMHYNVNLFTVKTEIGFIDVSEKYLKLRGNTK